MRDLLNTALLASFFLSLFAIAELLYRVGKVRVEWTRKLVHIGTGLLALLFPLYLGDHRLVLFLCASFAVILRLSLHYKWFPSINAIDRPSHGSLLYPLAVYASYLAYHFAQDLTFFYLPVLTLAICDPLAALVGKRFPRGKYKVGASHKTLVGSSAFWVSSCALAWVFLPNYPLFGAILATVAALLEAVSTKGLDNIAVPSGVLGMLYIWANFLR